MTICRRVWRGEASRDTALTTASDAARIILDGVKRGEWRILVGPDAVLIDEMVREDPVNAYTKDTFKRWLSGIAQLRLTRE